MRRQRNIFQRKEQGRAPKELSEVDIGNIPDKELKAVTVKMLRELGRRLYEPSGKFTKESEDVKKNQVELNNTIAEIKIILEEINGLPWGKNTPANAGDVGSVPGSGKTPEEGNGNPLQYSGLENSMERGA